jgi:periplasmic protein TonB
MKLSQLNTVIKSCFVFSASALLFVSCNDDKSANNSTPGASSDTTTSTEQAPVVAKTKKSGKVTTSISAGDTKVKMEKDKMGYYNRSEVLPTYNGGQSAIENYISNNIEYPQHAIDNNVEGVVSVQFGIDENGNISNVSTVGNKIGHGLEEEAIRVVSKMPKWTPGQVKGKNVKTWRTLPINYRLEG